MAKLKVRLIGVGIALLLQPVLANETQRQGMAEERKLEVLENLKNYKTNYQKLDQNLSPEKKLEKDKICSKHYYKDTKYCLEKEYMEGGKYLIVIRYINDLDIPPPPKERSKMIKGKVVWNLEEKEVYLDTWRNQILHNYLGSGYEVPFSPMLMGIDEEFALIKIKAQDPSVLERLIGDPRIVTLHSVVSPQLPLEEIVE